MNTRQFNFFKPHHLSPKPYIHSNNTHTGYLYIISGPSGAGKTSIIEKLLLGIKSLEKVVAYTTRKMRAGEIDNHTYHFIDTIRFQNKLQNGDFLIHLNFSGNYYGFGLSKNEVMNKLLSGTDLIVDIDYSQVNELKSNIENSYAIFIMPTSLQELQNRLINRGDASHVIDERMTYAQNIMNNAHICDKIIFNGDGQFNEAVETINAIIKNNRLESTANTMTYNPYNGS